MDASIGKIANIRDIVKKFYKFSPSLKNKIQELSGQEGDDAAEWATTVIDNDYCPTHNQIEHSSMLSAALQSDIGAPFNVFFNGERGNMPKLKINQQMSLIDGNPNYADNNLVMLPDIAFDPQKYKITFTFHGFAYYDNLGRSSIDSSVIEFYPYEGTSFAKEIHGAKSDIVLSYTRMTSAVYQRIYEYNGYPELQFRFKGIQDEETHERYVRLLDADFDNVWEPEENDFKYIYNDPNNKFINYNVKINNKPVLLPYDMVLNKYTYTLSDIEDDINVDVYADDRRTVRMKINTYGKLDVSLQLPDMHKHFVNCISDVQFDMGVVLKIPVRYADELITIESTPSYHYYTISGIEATEDLTEYIVTDDDAELGYVPVVATNRAYIRSISLKRLNVLDRTVSWDWSDMDDVDDVDYYKVNESDSGIHEISSDEVNDVKIIVDVSFGRARVHNNDTETVLKVEYGAKLQIPVRHKGDVITIKYNNGDERDTVEYIATDTDAANGYYEIGTRATEVLNIHSISIKQVPYHDDSIPSGEIVKWDWRDGTLPVNIKDTNDIVESNIEGVNLDVDATLYNDSVCIIRDPKRYYMMKCPYSNVNMFKLKIKMTENEIEKQRQKDDCEYESVMCTFAYGGISLEPFELPLEAVDDVLTLDSRTSFQSEEGKIVFQPNVSYSLILKLKKKMKFKDIKFIVLNSGGVSNIQVYHNYIQLSPMFNMSSNNITYSVIPTEDELKGAKPSLQNMRIVLPANSALIPGRSVEWDYLTIGSVPYGGYKVYFSEGEQHEHEQHFTQRSDGSYVYEMPPYFKPNLAYGVTIYATFVQIKNAIVEIRRQNTEHASDLGGEYYKLEVYNSKDDTHLLLPVKRTTDPFDQTTEDAPPYWLEAESYDPNTIYLTIRRYVDRWYEDEDETETETEDSTKYIYTYTLYKNNVIDDNNSGYGIMNNGQYVNIKLEKLSGFVYNRLILTSRLYISDKKISVKITNYINNEKFSDAIINDPDIQDGRGAGVIYVHNNITGEDLILSTIPTYLPDDRNPESLYYDYSEIDVQSSITTRFKLDFTNDVSKKYCGVNLTTKLYLSKESSNPDYIISCGDINLPDNNRILELNDENKEGYIQADVTKIEYELQLLQYGQKTLTIIYDKFTNIKYNRLYEDNRVVSLDDVEQFEYSVTIPLIISLQPKIWIKITPRTNQDFYNLYYHRFKVTGKDKNGTLHNINLGGHPGGHERLPGGEPIYNIISTGQGFELQDEEGMSYNMFNEYTDVTLTILHPRMVVRHAYLYTAIDFQYTTADDGIHTPIYPSQYKIYDTTNNRQITLDSSVIYTKKGVEYIRYYNTRSPYELSYQDDDTNDHIVMPNFRGDNIAIIDNRQTNLCFTNMYSFMAHAKVDRTPANTNIGLGYIDNSTDGNYWSKGVGSFTTWSNSFGENFSGLPTFSPYRYFSEQLNETFDTNNPLKDTVRLYLYLYVNIHKMDFTKFIVLKIREIEPYEVNRETHSHIHKDIPSWVREDIEDELAMNSSVWNAESDKTQLILQDIRRDAFEPFEMNSSVGPDYEKMWYYNPFYGSDNYEEYYEEKYPDLIEERHRLPYGYISTGGDTYFRIDVQWLDNNGNANYNNGYNYVPAQIFSMSGTQDYNKDYFDIIITGATTPDPEYNQYWYEEAYNNQADYSWALGEVNDDGGIDSTIHPDATHCILVKCKKTLEPNIYQHKWSDNSLRTEYGFGRIGSFNRIKKFIGFGDVEQSEFYGRKYEWGKVSKFCNPLINKMVRFNKDFKWDTIGQMDYPDPIDKQIGLLYERDKIYNGLPSHHVDIGVSDQRIKVYLTSPSMDFNIENWASDNNLKIDYDDYQYYINSDSSYGFGDDRYYHLLMSCHYAKTILDTSVLNEIPTKFGIPITTGTATGMRDDDVYTDIGYKYVGDDTPITDGLRVYYSRKSTLGTEHIDIFEFEKSDYSIGTIFDFSYNSNLTYEVINYNLPSIAYEDVENRFNGTIDISSGYYYIPIKIVDSSWATKMIEDNDKDSFSDQKLLMMFDKYGVRARYDIPLSIMDYDVRYMRLSYSAVPQTELTTDIQQIDTSTYRELVNLTDDGYGNLVGNRNTKTETFYYLSTADEDPSLVKYWDVGIEYQQGFKSYGVTVPNTPGFCTEYYRQNGFPDLDEFPDNEHYRAQWESLHNNARIQETDTFIEVTRIKDPGTGQYNYYIPVQFWSNYGSNNITNQIHTDERIGLYLYDVDGINELTGTKYISAVGYFKWNDCIRYDKFKAGYIDSSSQFYKRPLIGREPSILDPSLHLP